MDVLHLKVSQVTAVQQFDQQLAVQLKDNASEEPAKQLKCVLNNDCNNACAFLFVKIADAIHRGYYTVARRYEFYVRVARTISHE